MADWHWRVLPQPPRTGRVSALHPQPLAPALTGEGPRGWRPRKGPGAGPDPSAWSPLPSSEASTSPSPRTRLWTQLQAWA